jgi:hypothetical protein
MAQEAMVPLHMAGVSFSQTGETGFHSIWDAAIVSGDNEAVTSRLSSENLLDGLMTELAGSAQVRLFRVYEGCIHKMFAEEPGLQFIGPQHVADDQIVGAIVAQLVGKARQLAAVADDDLVGIQQAGNLHWDLFPAPRRTLDARGFGHVGSHGN